MRFTSWEGKMICHDHKCIFIHIPATAGTSIEEWIVGDDWWNVDPRTKHLLASQAKREYAEFWNRYFKFSIVRNPASRMKSALRFPSVSFLKIDQDGNIDLSGYLRRFERHGVVVEYDWRFYERHEVELERHRPGSLYGNILDEELDFVGSFEDLAGTTRRIASELGIGRPFLHHSQASPDAISRLTISDQSRSQIERLFYRDYARFGFAPSTGPATVDVATDLAGVIRTGQEHCSVMDSPSETLRQRIEDLLIYRDSYRELLRDYSEKNKVIALLQKTVTSLIIDRDAYRAAVENDPRQSVIKELQRTVESLIADRDAYRTLAEKLLAKASRK